MYMLSSKMDKEKTQPNRHTGRKAKFILKLSSSKGLDTSKYPLKRSAVVITVNLMLSLQGGKSAGKSYAQVHVDRVRVSTVFFYKVYFHKKRL